MRSSSHPASREAGFYFVAICLVAAVLVFAPLIKGGNRTFPLIVLELAALALFALATHRPNFLQQLPRSFMFALALFILLPLLQLLPLPATLWAALPGNGVYAGMLADLLGQEGIGNRVLSIVPHATEAAWLTMLPPLAIFLVSIGLPDRRLKQAVYVFLGMAGFQAVLSLAQYGTGSAAVFWSTPELAVQNGRGTYANHNHLAGLLEMALPIALGLLAFHFHGVQEHARRYHRRGLRARLSRLFSHRPGFNRTMVFGAISLAILLGLILTRSRSGIVLGMLGLLLAALLFARRLGGRATGITTVLGILGLTLAAEIALVPIMERFGVDATEDSRWSIFAGSLQAIASFFPFGSGIGTFPEVYPRFQAGDIGGLLINHAHNDYLEWLLEAGLIGGIMLLVFLGFYLYGWRRVWTREHWNELRFMQTGAGIALLLLMLHGLTDFNLHIPANAIYFAFLAAVFLHRQEDKTDRIKEAMPAAPPAPRPEPARPAPANIPNPFDD